MFAAEGHYPIEKEMVPGLRCCGAAPVSALAVAIGLAIILPFISLGNLSGHMSVHIVAMSVVAPVIAAAGRLLSPQRRGSARPLWAATAGQIILLWGWHLPSAHLAAAGIMGALLMHLSLLAAAIWFWDALIRLPVNQQWHGILALLVTGKLACLLAGLLVFATRPLFGHHGMAASLDDQQLAGLLMIVACPASYVLAAVIVAARFVGVTRDWPQLRTD